MVFVFISKLKGLLLRKKSFFNVECYIKFKPSLIKLSLMKKILVIIVFEKRDIS